MSDELKVTRYLVLGVLGLALILGGSCTAQEAIKTLATPPAAAVQKAQYDAEKAKADENREMWAHQPQPK